MDTRDWHILWGVPPKYDNESNSALDDNATLVAAFLRLRSQRHSRRPHPAGCGR